jgi:predicted nucleic acid-binding protein
MTLSKQLCKVDEQKTKRQHEKVISQLYKVNTEQNIYNIFLINMTQSCQIKQRYTFHFHPAFIE